MDNSNCNPSKGGCCSGCADERDHCGGGKMIMLSTQDGQEIPCSITSTFGVDEMDYIALRQVNNEVLIFRYTEDSDGSINMDNIKSDEEFDRVSEVFKSKILR